MEGVTKKKMERESKERERQKIRMRERKEMQNVRLKERTGGIEKDIDDIMLYYRDK